jgi:CRISPR/Cas system CSM-associated protein Csm3 (group 7 of RAMP superfamily)
LAGSGTRGRDLSDQTRRIPLIKTSIERDKRLLIPGSSLKGVVRSAYEAITRSCLCKVTKRYKKGDRTVKVTLPQGQKKIRLYSIWLPSSIRKCLG